MTLFESDLFITRDYIGYHIGPILSEAFLKFMVSEKVWRVRSVHTRTRGVENFLSGVAHGTKQSRSDDVCET